MTKEQFQLIQEVRSMIVSCSTWRATESRAMKKMIERLDKVIELERENKAND